jgi:anti-sigma factor RsiW
MNCADFESLICDYADGALDSPARAADKAALDAHLAQCPECAGMAEDSAVAVRFMGRAADVEPPPQLITRILFDAPWRKEHRGTGVRAWLDRILSPILQPRLVMGMAMSILSLSLMFNNVRQLKPSDLEPAKVWAGIEDRAERAWARTVKFYDNLKVVYQVESLLHEWQQQDEEQQRPAAKPAVDSDPHRLPVKTTPERSK